MEASGACASCINTASLRSPSWDFASSIPVELGLPSRAAAMKGNTFQSSSHCPKPAEALRVPLQLSAPPAGAYAALAYRGRPPRLQQRDKRLGVSKTAQWLSLRELPVYENSPSPPSLPPSLPPPLSFPPYFTPSLPLSLPFPPPSLPPSLSPHLSPVSLFLSIPPPHPSLPFKTPPQGHTEPSSQYSYLASLSKSFPAGL